MNKPTVKDFNGCPRKQTTKTSSSTIDFDCGKKYLPIALQSMIILVSKISSLIMGVFFKFGTSPLYQSQVLFLSFNFMCISSQKIFGKCTAKGVKGQGVKYDPPKGVKISKWSKLNSDCRFGFLSKK